jgi:hypothetical protein
LTTSRGINTNHKLERTVCPFTLWDIFISPQLLTSVCLFFQTYSLTGEKLEEFGSRGEEKGQFFSPECVAVDHLGFILVGDSGNARVKILQPNGTVVKVFGGRGTNPGKFSWVSGITVASNMDIIVTDAKNGCVQIF